MGSNTTYFALAIIRQLEKLGVYCCKGSQSIETVKDKLQMHQLLAQSNFPTPKTMLVKFPIDVEIVKREIGFPLIIKNITGTEGAGIYLCETDESFNDLMELIYSHNKAANIILQEFISESRGKDLRVFVLGGRTNPRLHPGQSQRSYYHPHRIGADICADFLPTLGKKPLH